MTSSLQKGSFVNMSRVVKTYTHTHTKERKQQQYIRASVPINSLVLELIECHRRLNSPGLFT